MNNFIIFIFGKSKSINTLIESELVKESDNKTTIFDNIDKLIESIYKNPDVIICYSIKYDKFIDIIDNLKKSHVNAEIIIISEKSNVEIEDVVNFIKNGAYDYIITDDRLRLKLLNDIKEIKEIKFIPERFINNVEDIHLIGESKKMFEIYPLIDKASKTDISVSIFGETGTGKEVVAKIIHFNSNRANHPFVPIDISAIPEELVESELFGYEKGAFTDAKNMKIGKFEEANYGTIFIDEIANIPLNIQAKLLRVLQDFKISRIGSNKFINLDLKVIIATNKDLFTEVKKGNFREDLYYRLLGLTIFLPPLRERIDDIPLLSQHFINNFCKRNNTGNKIFTPGALNKLLSYEFPGNVRELKSIIELACVLSDNHFIDEKDICFQRHNFCNDNLEKLLEKQLTLNEYKNEIIMHYLNIYNNNIDEVAKILGIGKSTIYRLLSNEKKGK
jgi:DNA-binding NtrC family response regulator